MELVSRVGLVIGEWPSTITASHSESGRNIYQPNRIIINLSQSNQIRFRTRNPDLSLDDFSDCIGSIPILIFLARCLVAAIAQKRDDNSICSLWFSNAFGKHRCRNVMLAWNVNVSQRIRVSRSYMELDTQWNCRIVVISDVTMVLGSGLASHASVFVCQF